MTEIQGKSILVRVIGSQLYIAHETITSSRYVM